MAARRFEIIKQSVAGLAPALFGFAISKSWIHLALLHFRVDGLPYLSFDVVFSAAAILIAILSLKLLPAVLSHVLLPVGTGLLLASSALLLAADAFPAAGFYLVLFAMVAAAGGVVSMAMVWTNAYSLFSPARVAFFVSGSILISYVICFVVEYNPPQRLFVILALLALLAAWCCRIAFSQIASEQGGGRGVCKAVFPYRAVIFVAAYSFAYGLTSSSGFFTEDPHNYFQMVPPAIVLGLIVAGSKHFSMKTLYHIAFPTMICGLLFVTIITELLPFPTFFLLEISYAAMEIMVTLIACSIAYSSGRPVFWVFGLFMFVQFLSKSAGDFVRIQLTGSLSSVSANSIAMAVALVFVIMSSMVLLSERSIFSQWGSRGDVGGSDGNGDLNRIRLRIDDLAPSYGLTQREIEVLDLMVQGKTVRGIANDMFIVEGTVKAHIQHIYQKLDVHSRRELLALLDANPRTF